MRLTGGELERNLPPDVGRVGAVKREGEGRAVAQRPCVGVRGAEPPQQRGWRVLHNVERCGREQGGRAVVHILDGDGERGGGGKRRRSTVCSDHARHEGVAIAALAVQAAR